MLKRKIYNKLLEWKTNKAGKCLLIKGARQVGKTYIIERFGENEYKHFISINFILEPELKEIFSHSLNADDVLMRLSLYRQGAEFSPGETLIFFDEIQTCPLARTALKSFALDGRYDVIASGSLLGLHYGQDPELDEEIPSVPVGYEEELMMHSLDFEEFLWANGIEESTISYIRDFMEREEKVPDDINSRMMDLFRLYAAVGGMPKAVSVYLETKNMNLVQREQDAILSSYADDIGRHARNTDRQKIQRCWNSIPLQLAKENSKFQFSKVESKATAKKYLSSIEWLRDAAIINLCTNVSVPYFPLKAYAKEDYFKVYLNDIGLLSAMLGYSMKAAIIDKKLQGPLKGGFYENLIGELLVKQGHQLFYLKKEGNAQEIEFLIEKDADVFPVEVKAKNGATISLNEYISHYNPKTAYKLADANIGRDGTKLTLPHYFVMFL